MSRKNWAKYWFRQILSIFLIFGLCGQVFGWISQNKLLRAQKNFFRAKNVFFWKLWEYMHFSDSDLKFFDKWPQNAFQCVQRTFMTENLFPITLLNLHTCSELIFWARYVFSCISWVYAFPGFWALGFWLSSPERLPTRPKELSQQRHCFSKTFSKLYVFRTMKKDIFAAALKF